jgi:hypothetical protein
MNFGQDPSDPPVGTHGREGALGSIHWIGVGEICGRSTVWTIEFTIKIQLNLTSGARSDIGAIIDWTGTAGEVDECNNATPTGILVQ